MNLNVKSEIDLSQQTKELADRFMNDTMFVRAIYCNPKNEIYIKECVKADDISVYTSHYLQVGQYLMSKDITRELEIIANGYEGDDLANNRYTIIVQPKFY